MFRENDYDAIQSATVYDQAGDKVGRVGTLYTDDDTGRPSWVSVNTGLFGTSESFVPLDDAARLDGDRLHVPYDKALIKDAPRVEDDEHLSEAEEAELYRHYQRNHTARDYTATNGESGRTGRDLGEAMGEGETMTAAEERLNVGTEQVERGRARLRKYVTTEQQSVTVPVEKEVLSVEREPVTGESRSTGRIGDDEGFEEEVVLREEQPVVSKEVRDVERVRVGKETVTEQQQVTDEVKKEHIAVEGDGDAVNESQRR